ncbi:MAG: hypothetical protein ABFD20_00435 [Anaerolineales bacterium]
MCSNSRRRAARRCVALWLVAALAACSGGEAPPAPEALPTAAPRPTEPATLAQALDGALFTLHLSDELLGVEEFVVQDTESGLVLYSELRLAPRADQPLALLQRRTLLLSGPEAPLHYELEESAGKARNLWVAERSGGALALLSDDQNAPLPVLVDDLAPAPDVLIEGRPSALPYALLAWQQTAPDAEDERSLTVLDVTAPLPAAVPLTLGPASASTGEVIGAQGYHGSAPEALNPAFDLWARVQGRSLVRVRVPDYQWGYAAQQTLPGLASGQTLVIQRVNEAPAWPQVPTEGEAFTFTDAQGHERQAQLRLPTGAGPHPVAITLGPEGLRPAWPGGEALLAQGWALCSYLPRGLNAGDAPYERGALAAWADDALAAAETLATRSDIAGERIVLLSWRTGALVAAQALAADPAAERLAGAVLLDPPAPGAYFPEGVAWHNAQVLAPAVGWSPEQTARYDALTLEQGRDWLFEGTDELIALGRRLDLTYLRTYADADLATLLLPSSQPVLVLVDPHAPWAPADAAATLAADLTAQGREGITGDLTVGALLDPASEQLTAAAAEAIADWLDTLP